MDKFLPILIIVGIIIIGFIMRVIDLKRLVDREEFTDKYRSKFVPFINQLFKSHSFNNQLYHELTYDVKEMQIELGEDGVSAYAADQLKGFAVRNYQMLINFLPEIRDALNDINYNNHIMTNRYVAFANDCNDAFVRHLGSLDKEISDTRKKLWNPFSNLSYGVRSIISFPFLLLNWFGLLTYERASKVRMSWFVSLLNFIVVIIGLISAVITIVIGKDEFLQIVHNIFN
jgi:hypothetical protein